MTLDEAAKIAADRDGYLQGSIVEGGECYERAFRAGAEWQRQQPQRSHNFMDLTGQTYGRLTVVSEATGLKGFVRWRCRCVCGRFIEVRANTLRQRLTMSCGCYRREVLARGQHHNVKHGHARGGKTGKSLTYRTWQSMRQRCLDPKCDHYAYYGAQGITICDKWRDSFQAFLADVGERPSAQMSIDRIDGSRGYEPGNVRWATMSQQNYNRRTSLYFLDVNDQPLTVQDIANHLAMPRWAVYHRFSRMAQ